MSQQQLAVFAELVRTPFQHLELVWGIVPLYFALLFSELTSAKKSFRTAIQTGFSFLWAGAQWLYLYRNVAATTPAINMALKGLQPVNRLVDSALWADAVAREEMSGHSTRRGADLWSAGWPRLHLLPQLLPKLLPALTPASLHPLEPTSQIMPPPPLHPLRKHPPPGRAVLREAPLPNNA